MTWSDDLWRFTCGDVLIQSSQLNKVHIVQWSYLWWSKNGDDSVLYSTHWLTFWRVCFQTCGSVQGEHTNVYFFRTDVLLIQQILPQPECPTNSANLGVQQIYAIKLSSKIRKAISFTEQQNVWLKVQGVRVWKVGEIWKVESESGKKVKVGEIWMKSGIRSCQTSFLSHERLHVIIVITMKIMIMACRHIPTMTK